MASDEQAEGISDVIGRNVRRLRGDRNQDDVAKSARAVGLAWSRQVVSGVESGVRQLDLAEATLLAVALRVGVLELLAGDNTTVVLSKDASAPLDIVRRVIGSESAGDVRINDLDTPESRAVQTMVPAMGAAFAEWSSEMSSLGLSKMSLDTVIQAEAAAEQLVEQRAAARLGTTARRVSLVAYDMWGHSLTEERDRRAAVRAPDTDRRSVQAFRGRITRELLVDLAHRLEED
ncbi:MAG: helix-turn-helix domain-containing protein [Acidimicrobiales bacterium]